MNEEPKHEEALEYFISLGAKLSDDTVTKVSLQCHCSGRTIKRWYKAFNWRNRADIRLNIIAKKVEKKNDTNIVNRKAKELADLDATDTIIQAMLNEIVTKDENGRARLKVKIDDARGFAQVVGASEKIKKLKQSLLGEDTEREDHTVRFLLDGIDISKFPKGNKDSENEQEDT